MIKTLLATVALCIACAQSVPHAQPNSLFTYRYEMGTDQEILVREVARSADTSVIEVNAHRSSSGLGGSLVLMAISSDIADARGHTHFAFLQPKSRPEDIPAGSNGIVIGLCDGASAADLDPFRDRFEVPDESEIVPVELYAEGLELIRQCRTVST